MKTIFSLLTLSAIILASSSCTHVKGAIEERYCSELGAYQKGMNDGLNRAQMDDSWISVCGSEDQHEFAKKYQEGFSIGVKKSPEQP